MSVVITTADALVCPCTHALFIRTHQFSFFAARSIRPSPSDGFHPRQQEPSFFDCRSSPSPHHRSTYFLMCNTPGHHPMLVCKSGIVYHGCEWRVRTVAIRPVEFHLNSIGDFHWGIPLGSPRCESYSQATAREPFSSLSWNGGAIDAEQHMHQASCNRQYASCSRQHSVVSHKAARISRPCDLMRLNPCRNQSHAT